ncbi:hypothetical protein PLICRDRAFT_109024 [Plicaturopsis crispa FD-325 SS-3]|nr:hypothetical protein PLICRDRAFT_109024 [Plicaturopsis crispa FD-325 SS-3]
MTNTIHDSNGKITNGTRSLPDLSRHLSSEARAMSPNPMKEAMRQALAHKNAATAVSLANGDPHYSLYPFNKIEWFIPRITESEPDPFPAWRTDAGVETQTLTTSNDPKRTAANPYAIPIKNAFGYTSGAGLPGAQKLATDLMKLLHRPPPSVGHMVGMTLGNADGIAKAFRMLGDRGDYFFAEEFCFSGCTNGPRAWGVKWVPVRMDRGGLVPEDMERVLQGWDEARGRRPHVLYITPCGQNPTGTTLSLERRRKIYEICQTWDIMIVEDDPYYFLQYDLPEKVSGENKNQSFAEKIASTYIPSFLSMDVDGRVMRLDSFSKILAPGMRLGWLTLSPLFHDKLVHYTDAGPQHPSAFGQCIVTEMLGPDGWGHDGFLRWVRSLCNDYQRRRDWLLEVFRREVGDSNDERTLATAVVPQAGMFVWAAVRLERHPRFVRRHEAERTPTDGRTNSQVLLKELFETFKEQNLFVMLGSVFATPGDSWAEHESGYVPLHDRSNFYRLTFSGTEDTIEQGVIIFGRVLKEFFAH